MALFASVNNPGKKQWNKVKNLNKIGQDKNALISTCYCVILGFYDLPVIITMTQ